MPRYIDADKLERKVMGLGEDVICDDCTYEFINLIDDAPTADVVPVVHGKWIRNIHDKTFCSACGTRYPEWSTDGMNYCHNCGAMMEEEGTRYPEWRTGELNFFQNCGEKMDGENDD